MRKNKDLFGLLCSLTFMLLIYLAFSMPSVSSAPDNPLILGTFRPQIDTFVSSARPTSSFPIDFGLWVGNRSSENWGNQRSLLQFEIPADITTTTTITTATVALYVAAWPNNDRSLLGVQVYRVKPNWNETIVWNDLVNMIDANIAPVETSVPAREVTQQWDVSTLLQSWIKDPARSKNFGILIRATNETSNQFRGFWSNECPVVQCDGKQPKLILDYATATPTATPTNTPSPTPTATPTPGIKTIRLGNEPRGALAGDDIVVYTIELQNGAYTLSNVVVSNILPEETELLRESIESPPGWRVEVTGRMIKWQRTTLAVNDTAVVSYRAQRHTPTATLTPTPTTTMIVTAPTTPATRVTETPPTPTPTTTATLPAVTVTPSVTPTITPTAPPTGGNLTITKSGPDAVAIGATIRYVLVVTNPFTRTLTGLTIADLLPVGADVVDFGGGAITMPPSLMIQWQAPLLSAQGSVTRTFAIRPSPGSSQVINDLYFVDVVENGVLRMRAVGKEAVVTTIIGGGLEPGPFAPVSLTAPLTASLPIINRGAVVTWEYPGYSNQLASNRVSNPFQLYLPFVPHR